MQSMQDAGGIQVVITETKEKPDIIKMPGFLIALIRESAWESSLMNRELVASHEAAVTGAYVSFNFHDQCSKYLKSIGAHEAN